jgi:hypothetical protein
MYTNKSNRRWVWHADIHFLPRLVASFDPKASHLKFCTLREDEEPPDGSTVLSPCPVATAGSLPHHRLHHRPRTPFFLDGLHAPVLCNTSAKQSFGIMENLSHLQCLWYYETVLSHNQRCSWRSNVLSKQLKKRRSFGSHFVFSSSYFTIWTVRCHCSNLDFIPYRSFTFVVCTASRPATRCMWMTTKRTVSTRLVRRKCFPCVTGPCTMELHAANNCRQEGGHFAGRDTHAGSSTTAGPAKAARIVCTCKHRAKLSVCSCDLMPLNMNSTSTILCDGWVECTVRQHSSQRQNNV